MQFYSLVDIIFGPLYLALILISARIYAKKKVLQFPEYKYFVGGLTAKIVGGLGLAFVYSFYYPGGDTLQYFFDAMAFQKLFFVDFDSFVHVFFRKAEISNYYYFSSETGFPAYCRDPKAWFVVKIALFLVGFGFQSFVATTLLCAWLSYLGNWKLYQVFVSEYPALKKELAIAFLFVPSVFFWGSGLLKDTFTLSALGWSVWSIYNLFVKGQKQMVSVLALVISSVLILSIKPYILVGLVPAFIVWVSHRLIGRIYGGILKTAAIPIMVLLGVGFGYMFMTILGGALQEYQLDNILEKAVVNQRDLKSDYHKGNAFDIGEFDPTVQSILAKFPIATFSAIFRPLIIEANNIVMFVSGIENLLILIFTIKVIIFVRGFGFFRLLKKGHLLSFSFTFAILFAYSVGLSTSNFGSLVRYKIPCVPFFIATLYITRYMKQKELEDEAKNLRQVPNYEGFVVANKGVFN
jgi:hypothetical protein